MRCMRRVSVVAAAALCCQVPVYGGTDDSTTAGSFHRRRPGYINRGGLMARCRARKCGNVSGTCERTAGGRHGGPVKSRHLKLDGK